MDAPLLDDLHLTADDLALLSAPLIRVDHAILATRPLTEGDARRASITGPAPDPPKSIKALRQSHHRAAQLLAAGASVVAVSRVTGYSSTHLDRLRDDPAFQELLAHYEKEVTEELADFARLTADLTTDMVAELRERLESEPERISTATLLEAIKVVGDRSPYAPVARSVQTNIHVGIGDRMLKARGRLAAQAPVVTSIEKVE